VTPRALARRIEKTARKALAAGFHVKVKK